MDVTRIFRMSIAVTLLAATPMACISAAEADPFDGRLLPVELVMAHRAEIDLSRAQSRSIGELVVGVQKAVAGYQWEMQTAYFELMEVLDEADIDEERAIALAKKAVDTENQIKLEQMRLLIRLRNLLTEEQVAVLQTRRAEKLAKAGG